MSKAFPANSFRFFSALALSAFLISGCVLAPEGTRNEQQRAAEAGKPFEPPIEKRVLEELPQPATWRDALRRAFLTNGDLEAAYFQWKAALARIPQAAEYPNTNVAPSFSYLFSGERMKAWDRSTINVGFDPMRNLALPNKVAVAGKIALQDAQAAGSKFETAKFELQRKVLTDYLDLVLHDRKIALARDNVELLKLLSESASNRLAAGGNQQDLLRAQTQQRLAENELGTMHAEHRAMVARLNAIMGRQLNASLILPPDLPTPRPVSANDAELIALATDRNPELQRLAHEVQGRKDAIELARLSYWPDINPMAAFTGSVSQMAGAMIVLPTTLHEIRGKIDEERAMLRSEQAMLRQAKADRAASFVAALLILRNSERQAEVFQKTILPRAEQALASSRQAYTAGTGIYIDLIDAQRTVLDVRLTIAEAQIEREKRLADLEQLAGVDIETLGHTGGSGSTPTSSSGRSGSTPTPVRQEPNPPEDGGSGSTPTTVRQSRTLQPHN